MKKIKLMLGLTILPFIGVSQSTTATNIQNIGQTRYLGFDNNFPLFTKTAGITRTRLSGNLPAVPALGTTVNLTGHFGIGLNGYFNNPNNAPLTMLHLEGNNNTLFNNHFGGQYRTWMRVGTFMRENSDAMYVGLKPEGFNRSDAVVNWSDDNGADKLRFLFTSTLLSLPGVIDPLRTDSQNGYEYMRMHASGPVNQAGTNAGYIGVGPLFSDALTPQNRLHMNAESGLATFLQISNVAGGGRPGTGQTGTDGLKLGLQSFTSPNGLRQYGYLQWQENTPFIVQTASTGLGASTATGERLRITSIGALNNTEGGFGGSTAPANRTRIAISLDGANPITRPLSLLHLGYNTGQITPFSAGVDGWRPWMELGMFTSNQTDHVFIGLKPESGVNPFGVNDRMDAVIGWGDNGDTSSIAGPANAPDVMRFIFTATQTSNVDSPQSRSANGLEVMRLYPERDTTTQLGGLTYGRVGVGDFTGQGVNEQPTHKLDVVGNGRFRYLPDSLYYRDSTVTKFVMVDEDGVLRWSPNVSTQFGADCSDSTNGMLNNDKKVVLNNNNLYFTNPTNALNFDENKIGIGYICDTNLPAKLAVRQLHDQTVSLGTTAGHFYNSDVANAILLTFTGVQGISDGLQNPSLRPINIGGKFTSRNSGVNHGINIDITNNLLSNSINYGIFNRVEDYNASSSYGMRSETRGAAYHAYGLYVIAASNYTSNPVQTQQTTGVSVYSFGGSDENIGLRAVSGGDDIGAFSFGGTNFGLKAYAKYGTSNYAVYGETTAGQPNSYAGYFVGPVVQNQPSIPSDQQFKTNVLDIENADSLIASIRPVTYDYQTTGNAVRMNFPSGIQYGMIAQEVESVMPELVKTVEHPAINDSVGNEIEPSFEYKVLNYEAFLPILIKGHQEQANQIVSKDSIIDSLQSQITDLNNRLTQLENCLSGILPLLCQLSNSAIQANTPAAQEEVRKTLSVTLSNRSAIVLDQNVPNPFAEQTIINFSIPETVQKAQIHFYDANGRFMNAVDIIERGLGSITVFGSDLSTGVYTYTLVADGQVVATKKMMKH